MELTNEEKMSMKIMRIISCVSAVLFSSLAFGQVQFRVKSQENIALHKPYTLSPLSHWWGITADAGDATQLTDGMYTVGYLWAENTTVGWDGAKEGVAITIDLGKVEPIKGISFSTAAGKEGGP